MVDLDKLIADSKALADSDMHSNGLDKELLRIAKEISERYEAHPWFLGIHMIEKLKIYGKVNVRNHMEKLVDKGNLETKLYKTNKVYRLNLSYE